MVLTTHPQPKRRGHERVGLYLYSPSGPSWPVIGRKKNNKEIINDNYGRLKGLILLFKITVGTRKILFEIYRRFVYVPSQRLGSTELGDHEVGLISVSGKHVSLCHCIQTGSYT